MTIKNTEMGFFSCHNRCYLFSSSIESFPNASFKNWLDSENKKIELKITKRFPKILRGFSKKASPW